MNEVNYELKIPFKYKPAKSGDQIEASFITLSSPSFKQMDNVAPMKQAFTNALTETIEGADDSAAPEDTEGTGNDEIITSLQVIQVLYRSKSDITKVFLYAEQLFKSGTALVDGEAKLTTPLMEKMHLDDFEGLVGAYIANFIAPSLMDGSEKSNG